MKINLMKIEFKKAISSSRILLFSIIIVIISVFQFFIIKDGYIYYKPLDVFEESISGFIPMLFPLIVLLFSNSYFSEYKNSFISHVYQRCDMETYLIQKSLTNALLTFIVMFLYIIVQYIFYIGIVPLYDLVEYSNVENMNGNPNTLSTLLKFGYIGYGIIYSTWIAINAAIYSTIAFILTLHIKKNIVALSIPILIYHIGNFVVAVLGKAQFSPLISIFPFSVKQQPIYQLLIPFVFLVICIIVLILYTKVKFKRGENYVE